MPSAKPLDTNPPLRPEAPHANCLASSKTTFFLRRASSSAVVSPASPPPITHTSAFTGPRNAVRGVPRSVVASYQVGEVLMACFILNSQDSIMLNLKLAEPVQ